VVAVPARNERRALAMATDQGLLNRAGDFGGEPCTVYDAYEELAIDAKVDVVYVCRCCNHGSLSSS